MIYIVTGGIDSGKTTAMACIYERLRRGDGFISQKRAAAPNVGDLSLKNLIIKSFTGSRTRGAGGRSISHFLNCLTSQALNFLSSFFSLAAGGIKATVLPAPTTIKGNNFIGYEIVRLATGERRMLAYKESAAPPGWDEIYRCGPYHFSQAALEFAGAIINDIIARGISPIFIDEIGPLELQDKGFAPLLEKALNTGLDVYITVRSPCLDEVIKKFNIGDYRLIEA